MIDPGDAVLLLIDHQSGYRPSSCWRQADAVDLIVSDRIIRCASFPEISQQILLARLSEP
jgi:hypothetical protein